MNDIYLEPSCWDLVECAVDWVEMSRPGAWSQVWKNLLKSVGAYEKHVAKKYVGEDRFGNRYYELPERASNVRR